MELISGFTESVDGLTSTTFAPPSGTKETDKGGSAFKASYLVAFGFVAITFLL
jgi:hypothetical protein